MSLLPPICLTQRPDTEAADLSVSFTTTLFLSLFYWYAYFGVI